MKIWKQIIALLLLTAVVTVGALAADITVEDDDTASMPIVTQSTKVKADRTLKILAIGNSFTNDTMRFVGKIAESAGYQVTVGVLWKSSVSLASHARYLESDEPVYQYDRFTRESDYERVIQEEVSASTALQDDWDLIFLQQMSHVSGVPSSYYDEDGVSYLTQMTEIIRSQCTNPDVSFSWLMGWAYAQDYDNSNFERYDNDQMTMFQAIADTVQNTVWATGEFESVIPVGTAIQNIRSSYIGDHLNRDGRHLTYSMGRYAAGLTVAAAIGIDLSYVTYRPTGSTNVNDLHLPMLRETISSAVLDPFVVSASAFTSEPERDAPVLTKLEESAGEVQLDWKGVDHAVSYYIYRRPTGGSWKSIETVSADDTNRYLFTNAYSYVDETIEDGTEYQYRVKAHFDSNLTKTTSSSERTCWMSTPTGLRCIRGDEALQVSGTSGAGVTQYEVRCATESDLSDAETQSITATSLPVTTEGLDVSTTYYVQIRSKKKVGSRTYYSEWSEIVSGTTSSWLQTPQQVKCTKKDEALLVRCEARDGVDCYQIRYATKKSMDGKKTRTVNKKSLSATLSGLNCSTRYYVQVRCRRDVDGQTQYSRWSDIVSGTTSKWLESVQNIRYISKNNAVQVRWQKSSGTRQYQIRYATKKNMSNASKITVSDEVTSKVIRHLKNKKNYYLQVRSRSTKKGTTYYSRWSEVASCKTS